MSYERVEFDEEIEELYEDIYSRDATIERLEEALQNAAKESGASTPSEVFDTIMSWTLEGGDDE